MSRPARYRLNPGTLKSPTLHLTPAASWPGPVSTRCRNSTPPSTSDFQPGADALHCESIPSAAIAAVRHNVAVCAACPPGHRAAAQRVDCRAENEAERKPGDGDRAAFAAGSRRAGTKLTARRKAPASLDADHQQVTIAALATSSLSMPPMATTCPTSCTVEADVDTEISDGATQAVDGGIKNHRQRAIQHHGGHCGRIRPTPRVHSSSVSAWWRARQHHRRHCRQR